MSLALQLLSSWAPLLACMSLWIAFSVYARRKLRSASSRAGPVSAGPSNTITVARRVDPTNILRAYRIIVDDQPVGWINAGEVKHFEVSPGNHQVSVRVDWCHSVPLAVSKPPESNVLVWCGATYNDWRCTFMAFIAPRRFVYVAHDA